MVFNSLYAIYNQFPQPNSEYLNNQTFFLLLFWIIRPLFFCVTAHPTLWPRPQQVCPRCGWTSLTCWGSATTRGIWRWPFDRTYAGAPSSAGTLTSCCCESVSEMSTSSERWVCIRCAALTLLTGCMQTSPNKAALLQPDVQTRMERFSCLSLEGLCT